MKGFFLIILALCIDGITAAISLAIFVIAAFPGTLGGAAAGCVAGQQVAGNLGCQIGAVIFGFLGSIPLVNTALAAITVPMGAMLGFAISIALNATLGAGLIIILIFMGMFYPKYMVGGVMEFIPGINCLPFWTTLVIASIIKNYADKKKISVSEAGVTLGQMISPESRYGRGISAVVGTQQQNMSIARAKAPRFVQPLQDEAREREENESDDYKRAGNQVIRDIRPRHI